MNWYGNDKYSTYGGNYPQFNCYGSQLYDSGVPPRNPKATDANNFFQISAGQQDIQHVQEHQQLHAPKGKGKTSKTYDSLQADEEKFLVNLWVQYNERLESRTQENIGINLSKK